ncbi:hypothetical protein Dimus_026830, partial [Dionaea muscipula]
MRAVELPCKLTLYQRASMQMSNRSSSCGCRRATERLASSLSMGGNGFLSSRHSGEQWSSPSNCCLTNNGFCESTMDGEQRVAKLLRLRLHLPPVVSTKLLF